jgi:hypothetical protein
VPLPVATTEAPDVHHLRVGAWLTLGGLALAALPLPATTALHAQVPTGAGQPAAGETEPTPDAPAAEQELIERLEAVRRDLQSAGAADEDRALGEDEVRTLVAEGLGVEILDIEATESQGRPAYAVTVMSPPGTGNSAFAVDTLLVDGATGGLLGRVPRAPRVAAPNLAGPSGWSDPDPSGVEIRRRSHR